MTDPYCLLLNRLSDFLGKKLLDNMIVLEMMCNAQHVTFHLWWCAVSQVYSWYFFSLVMRISPSLNGSRIIWILFKMFTSRLRFCLINPLYSILFFLKESSIRAVVFHYNFVNIQKSVSHVSKLSVEGSSSAKVTMIFFIAKLNKQCLTI